MILYIDACVREDSRTEKLAETVLKALGPHETVDLKTAGFKPLDAESLARRTELTDKGEYDDGMFAPAKQFAAADAIVIAAPFWDGSFPAILKIYLENIYVTGIVSKYDEQGRPCGLCSAEKLYFVTTAGGPYIPDYSYNYIRDLAVFMFGIKETELVFAENLDLWNSDPEKLVADAADKWTKEHDHAE